MLLPLNLDTMSSNLASQTEPRLQAPLDFVVSTYSQ
jgi:hypothetical protein